MENIFEGFTNKSTESEPTIDKIVLSSENSKIVADAIIDPPKLPEDLKAKIKQFREKYKL